MKNQIPILMSTPMVQAILAGRKTVTRREEKLIELSEDTYPKMVNFDGGHWMVPYWRSNDLPAIPSKTVRCPYGKPGDILWVRETWRKYCRVDENGHTNFDEEIIEYAADGHAPLPLVDGDGFQMYNKNGTEKYVPWRPNIHMPKKHSRIWLEVTGIRVERLHDISEGDAIAEGVEPNCAGSGTCPSPKCKEAGCQASGEYYHYTRDLDDFPAYSAKESFESLWEKINGANSWAANPWVWVVSFKVLSTTGKPAGLEKEVAG